MKAKKITKLPLTISTVQFPLLNFCMTVLLDFDDTIHSDILNNQEPSQFL